MKRFFCCLALLLGLLCGCAEEGPSVTLRLDAALPAPYTAEFFDAEGYSLGAVTLQEGKNALPAASIAYARLALPEEYDCPVAAFFEGAALLTVTAAEQSAEGYLHTCTVFAKGETEGCLLQICTPGEGGVCRTAPFVQGTASLLLADGEYTLEVVGAGGVLHEQALSFRFDGRRFVLLSLGGEA